MCVYVGRRGGGLREKKREGLCISLLDISNTELEHMEDGFCMTGEKIMAVTPSMGFTVLLKVH